MLDLDQEFDQSFDQKSAEDGAAEPEQPAADSSAPAGNSAASPPTRAEKPVFAAPIPAAARNGNRAGDTPAGAPVDGAGETGARSRSDAESAYQRIADEILESTKEVCQRLISDGEKALERAKFLEAENEAKCQGLQKETDSIGALRAEAESFRQQSLAAVTEAQKQAQEILDRARLEAETQRSGAKARAAAEAEQLVADAKAMKAAAQEELEAQKLYTEAARLKAESNEALSQLRQQMGSLLTSSNHRGSQPAPAAVQTAPSPDTAQGEGGVRTESKAADPAAIPLPGPAAVPAPASEAPPSKPVEEDATLSRKKAGRWFGL